MRPLSVQGQRAFELLSDGHWHEVTHVVAEVAKTYPPGRATRKVESQRLSKRRSRIDAGETVRGDGSRVKPSSLLDQVQVGQRRLARALLLSWLKGELVEFDRAYDPSVWRTPGVQMRATKKLLARQTPHERAKGLGGQMRAWARENGYRVPPSGGLSFEVQNAYWHAHDTRRQSKDAGRDSDDGYG